MGIINSILAKVAKPKLPETRCVRVADLKDVSNLPVDKLVRSPTGEALVPLSSLPVKAKNDNGSEQIYAVDVEASAQELKNRLPVLRLKSDDIKAVQNSKYLAKSLQIGPDGTGYLLADGLPKCFSKNKPYSHISSQPRDGLDDKNLPRFEQLSSLQRGLLGSEKYGEKRWSTEFSPREMKAFLVLTTLWEHPELADRFSQFKGQKPLDQDTLRSLKLSPNDFAGITLSSIHSDRKHFEVTFAGKPESMLRLGEIFGTVETNTKGEQTQRGYLADRPFEPFHPHTQDGGGRSPNSHYSLQFMLGEDHGAGDVDMYMPLTLPSETSDAGKRRAFVRHWAKHWGEIIVGKNILRDYMKPDKVADKLGINLYAPKP